MTDNEIIKALKCCGGSNCHECPIEGCTDDIFGNALNLINRQKAEILELQKRIINWRADMDYRPDEIKSEAIKEFAERLNARIREDIDEQGMFPLPYTKKAYDTDRVSINNLVKEIEEENENV